MPSFPLAWRIIAIALLVGLGSLGAATLAAEEIRSACRAEGASSFAASCEPPLTRWTLRLAYAQLAQYPPAHGTPETY